MLTYAGMQGAEWCEAFFARGAEWCAGSRMHTSAYVSAYDVVKYIYNAYVSIRERGVEGAENGVQLSFCSLRCNLSSERVHAGFCFISHVFSGGMLPLRSLFKVLVAAS
jgi:hypothetical protein